MGTNDQNAPRFRNEPMNPCIAAAARGDLAFLQREKPGAVSAPDASGMRAMHQAAASGHVAILEWLVASGVDTDVNKPDDDARTALHWAAWKGQGEAALALLEMGALINRKTRTGFTALHYAACSGNVDTIRLLVSHGASLVAKDESNRTPAELASFLSKTEAAAFLVDEAPALAATARSVDEPALDTADPLGPVAASQEHANLDRVFQAAARIPPSAQAAAPWPVDDAPTKPMASNTRQIAVLVGVLLLGVALGGLLARRRSSS